ncbi:MAG TPA: serine hydrolase [Desulfobulbaceae bacterium]|nr:serine hydrolase [Desulfobulbaceae bacterium]
MNEEIAAIFARAKISSALALGLSWPDGEQRHSQQIYLGQPSSFHAEAVDAATVFDLASLTKPLVTTLSVHELVCQGKLTFSDRLAEIFPDMLAAAHPAWREIRIAQLLNHCSGLPAHRPYFNQLLALPQAVRKAALLRMISMEAPVCAAGRNHIYSDLGFMLLGFIVERLTGESLDAYWRRAVAEKIGIENSLFFPAQDKHPTFAESGICPWSQQILAGTVHDDNCRSLGGIAGHAGLFGTLTGVMAACDWLLALWHDTGREAEVLRNMCKPVSGTSWCLGFDSPSGPDSASGQYFRVPSVGHLGFTGTSFWIDLGRRISVVLLTNRTIYSWDRRPLNCFRRAIYDCVMRRFEGRPASRP